MRRSRFSEEQVIAILKEQEGGVATADVCRRHGISTDGIAVTATSETSAA